MVVRKLLMKALVCSDALLVNLAAEIRFAASASRVKLQSWRIDTWTRQVQVSLPAGRRRLVKNLPECQQLPVKACSKDAPDRAPMRVHVAATSIFLGSRLDARWQEVLGLVTRTRVASAVAREPADRIFDFYDHGGGVLLSSIVGQWLQW